jgi:hypothetical protein
VALSPQDADTTKHSVNSRNIVMHSVIRLVRLSSLVFILATTGCANLNSIHQESEFSKDNGGAVFIDAKQRSVISNPVPVTGKNAIEYQLRICSEAAPDVFSAFATSAAAKAAVNPVEKTVQGMFGLTSAESAATISRTQTINMLREAMFRTCERYLNGAIDKDELVVQAARDQRVMVSILAIEQLTGVYTPAIVALTTEAKASASGPTAENLKLIDDVKKEAEKATAEANQADQEAKQAEEKAQQANNEATTAETDAEEDAQTNLRKTCDEVLGDTNINPTDKDKCKLAKEKRDKAKELDVAAKTKREHYNTLIKEMADWLGSIATSASGAAHFSPEKSQPILSQNMEKIADAVARIVESTFRFDELQMTCVVELRQKKTSGSDLYKKCLKLLNEVVRSDIKKVEADIASKAAEMNEQFQRDKEKILLFVNVNGKVDQGKLQTLLQGTSLEGSQRLLNIAGKPIAELEELLHIRYRSNLAELAKNAKVP